LRSGYNCPTEDAVDPPRIAPSERDHGEIPDAGKVVVWTKADSVTYFDDLAVAPL
jgi:hypothetical protein